MRAARAGARLPLVALYALLLTLLLFRSSLAALLPFPAQAFPLGLYVWAGLLVALLPAVFTSGSPLPAMALVWVPAVAVAAYEESHLDWLRTLKDFDVVDPGAPDLLRVALAVAALLLAWATHALDTAWRLRARLVKRGVPPREARAAAVATARRTALAALVALVGFAGLLGFALLAWQIPPEAGRLTFLTPLLAAVLVVAAGVLLAARQKDEAPGADEA